MPDVVPFPPRSAGAVLDAAMKAAMDAATAALRQQQMRLEAEPWRNRGFGAHTKDPMQIEQAALMAALPLLRDITSSSQMASIVAHGMASEAMIRLRKLHGRHAVDLG
jgi:hypothetical protein